MGSLPNLPDLRGNCKRFAVGVGCHVGGGNKSSRPTLLDSRSHLAGEGSGNVICMLAGPAPLRRTSHAGAKVGTRSWTASSADSSRTSHAGAKVGTAG